MATAAVRRKYNTPGVVNGSLAYDFKTLERQLENTGYMEPDRLTRPMEETPADVIAHAHESAKAKVRTAQRVSPAMALGFAATAVMLVMLVMCYVELTTISASVVEKQEQLASLQTQQVTLITQHERAFDLSGVKEAAAAAGMSQPSDSQIYYIDLSEPDSATVYSQGESGVRQIFSLLGEGIRAAVEYFR